jgi:Holliday junction resolvase
MKKRRDIAEGALPPKEYRASVLAKKRQTLKQATESKKPVEKHVAPKEERRKVKEQKIQGEILRYLESSGFFAFKASAINFVSKGDSGQFVPTKAGIPDIIALKNGEFFAFEVKRACAGASVRPEQISTMEYIRKLGGHAFCVHSVMCVARYLITYAITPEIRLLKPIFRREEIFLWD